MAPPGRTLCPPPEPAPRTCPATRIVSHRSPAFCEFRRPSQREMFSGHLGGLIVFPQLYSPRPTFIDACEVLRYKERKTRTTRTLPTHQLFED